MFKVTTCDDKFKLIKLIIYCKVSTKEMEFIIECFINVDSFEFNNEDKVFRWIVNKLYETALGFEKAKSCFEQLEKLICQKKVLTSTATEMRPESASQYPN